MIEILAGPLVRAASGKEVKGTANPEEMCTKGDLIMAIDPSKFVDLDEFKEEVDEFIAEIKDSGENIFIPGDMEVMNVKKAKENGLPVDDTLYTQLKEIAQELSFDLDELLND
jgi:L-2-hydroxycarboxylate dehydrogenase (NAD+)